MCLHCLLQVCALRWRDKRYVHLLTTKHDPTAMSEVAGRTERKRKPDAVIDYIHNMAGVDHSDQMISYMPLHRKTLKWWRKLAFHLITLVMIQAHILYNKHRISLRSRPVTLEHFALSVCSALAAMSRPQENARPGAAAPHADHTRLTGRHFPVRIPPAPGKTRKQLACVVCYAKARREGLTPGQLRLPIKRTQMKCGECGVALCVHPCFNVYHTKKNYAVWNHVEAAVEE